ncbi:MAG: alpha/beta hydrolase [Burkholderiales bacterium]|jgi:pimeloyl-ACP methyl ester carboxylesterase|nr:alpha/beta hydrolase [Burkholderiales bacterium]
MDLLSLVLVPGLLCDAALWTPQQHALADVARTTVADVAQDASIDAMAARLLRDAPTGRFALAGLSMGGYVALAVMQAAPERVSHLALLDTNARADTAERRAERERLMALARTERGFRPVTQSLLPMLLHPSRLADAPLVDTIQAMAERVGPDAYVRQQTAIMGRPDRRDALAAIACPTLVLCGRDDTLTPPALHAEMADAIPGAAFEQIDACGHMATLERPDAVSAALRRWLGR